MDADLERFDEKVKRLVNQVKRGVALDIYGTLIGPPPEGTPVDKGVARAGWHYGVNRVITDVPSAGSGAPMPVADDAHVDVRLGDVINISNNVPYIGALEEGRSKQSPRGWVNAAVDRAVETHGDLVERIKQETR